MDRLRALMENLRDQFEAMTPRDRTLATALVATLTLGFAGGVTWYLKGILNDLAANVIAAKADLAHTQEMSGEYSVVAAKLKAAETRMGAFHANQINTYLEDWAKGAGMLPQLKEVKELGTETQGRYRQRDYHVEIDNAELGSIVEFLVSVETSPYPIRVKSAKFRADGVGDSRMMDVGLDLVTYDKPEGGG
jgi:hypothetical protein